MIKNLTPHAITILGENNEVLMAIPPEEVPARVRQEYRRMAGVDVEGIPYYVTAYGDIEGLPDPEEGVRYIVSALLYSAAAESARGCFDLYVPADQVRDDSGRVIGCRGLCQG